MDAVNKPKAIIRKRNLNLRKKSKKTSFLGTIWNYLTADCFMYGPLLAKEWRGPEVWHGSGIKERTRRKSRSNSPLGTFQDFFSSPRDVLKIANEPITKMIGHMEEVSETNGGQVVQGSYTTVRKTITTTTFVGGDDQGDQPSGSGGAQLQDPSTPKSVDIRGETDLTEQEADADEERSWGHDGLEDEDDFHDHIPLDDVEAEKVANQLVGGFGGRFSDDLGINVDASDNEVECWFLAANLFYRSISFEVSEKTYKELSEAGVSKVADLLSIEESRVADILERSGYTNKGRRVALQLKKLATHLEEGYWGRVSTFKHTSDRQELIRQLRSLPGVKLSTARIFLRELRGLWTGAPSEFEMKTKRAALHLKLLGSIKASSHPERVLSEFSQSAGIDLRDLEVALFKLGTEHEHHYDECEGAASCTALLPAEKLIQLLPSDTPV